MEYTDDIASMLDTDARASTVGTRRVFSYERDVPVLRCVRDAVFISSHQLFDIVTMLGLEPNRRCFRWRVERLVDGGLLRSLDSVWPYKGPVYGISREGLAMLETCGEGFTTLTSTSRSLPHHNKAAHYLELNDVRMTLEKSGALRRWRNETELNSLNILTDTPLAKDYDAVVELSHSEKAYTLAIEYERTMKSADRYKEINEVLRSEHTIDGVLYLVQSLEMLLRLSDEFPQPAIPMFFANTWNFKKTCFSTNVLIRFEDRREAKTLEWALANVVV